ncbi:saccharopine dehydrogenase NADP-binding domain-containing protein [uncultured Roseobacter sp.]|uniref:saccharopine dehydrogenase family protein n=1 Tax=uncultured Roseobacter sp. TaxID=114847 RepID=UPI00260361A5|nr:saccharopine dehydrogenase NADP-binding domain-containing protein [uncultured Roseobacter sp.]
MKKKRVLIIGGTGVFGRRLAQHLARWNDMELVLSSRSKTKARACISQLQNLSSTAKVRATVLEKGSGLGFRLEEINPDIVVDCSGPFQGSSYETARAVIQSGADYVDLADARDYLTRFETELDAIARQNQVSALAGASSTPALSACVVGQLAEGWQRVDDIDLCITPGGKSEVGRAVIAAILSYAGRSVPCWREGALSSAIGWSGGERVNIPDLGIRRVAPVETLDAELLGPRHDVRGRVSFSAGLESPIEQFGIEALALLRRRGFVRNLKRLIPVLLRLRQITRLATSDRGGMRVAVRGIDGHAQATLATWSLLAKDNQGPFVPILPAAATVRKLLAHATPPGACLADRHLELADILAETGGYQITTRVDIAHGAQ